VLKAGSVRQIKNQYNLGITVELTPVVSAVDFWLAECKTSEPATLSVVGSPDSIDHGWSKPAQGGVFVIRLCSRFRSPERYSGQS
jgi:hypothetical protein